MKKHKLSQFDMVAEMHQDIKQIKEDLIPKIKNDISVLKVKSGIWSTMTGIMGGVLAVITMKFTK